MWMICSWQYQCNVICASLKETLLKLYHWHSSLVSWASSRAHWQVSTYTTCFDQCEQSMINNSALNLHSTPNPIRTPDYNQTQYRILIAQVTRIGVHVEAAKRLRCGVYLEQKLEDLPWPQTQIQTQVRDAIWHSSINRKTNSKLQVTFTSTSSFRSQIMFTEAHSVSGSDSDL